MSVLGIIIVALLPTKSMNQRPQAVKELTEEEKVALAEKERKRAEMQVVLNKRRIRTNYILAGFVFVLLVVAFVMMATIGKQ